MTVTTTKKSSFIFFVGTSRSEILDALVAHRNPEIKGMFYDVAGSTYHIITESK